METLTYNPGIFSVGSIEEAKSIILTNEAHGTDERWDEESPYFAELIADQLGVEPGSLVLDYGCGIGRLAKLLIEKTGCSVIGVDISPSMRVLAQMYVQSERFIALSNGQFSRLVDSGLRVDCAYAVWVLQHCLDVTADLALIRGAMVQDSRFLVVNDRNRIVPTDRGWVNDGVDLPSQLESEFIVEDEFPLESDWVASNVAASSFVGVYRK